MSVKLRIMWIVIAFAAMAATAVLAAPGGRNIYLNYGSAPTRVTVDRETWDGADSATRAVEAVASNNRQRISGLEGDVGAMERAGAIDTSYTAGRGTTVNVYLPTERQETAPATSPPAPTNPPPSGGQPTQSAAERMSLMWNMIGAILAVLGGIVAFIILVVWAVRAVTIVNDNNENRLKEKNAEERRRRSAQMVHDAITGARGAIASDDPTHFPRAQVEAVIRDADGVVARLTQERTSENWLAMAAARVGPAGGVVGAGGSAVGGPTAREYTAAIAGLSRPSLAVPVGTAAVAAARPLASTDPNRDALATALVGVSVLTDTVVDAIRDSLVANGTITP